jgi:hypothetical protein
MKKKEETRSPQIEGLRRARWAGPKEKKGEEGSLEWVRVLYRNIMRGEKIVWLYKIFLFSKTWMI